MYPEFRPESPADIAEQNRIRKTQTFIKEDYTL